MTEIYGIARQLAGDIDGIRNHRKAILSRQKRNHCLSSRAAGDDDGLIIFDQISSGHSDTALGFGLLAFALQDGRLFGGLR